MIFLNINKMPLKDFLNEYSWIIILVLIAFLMLFVFAILKIDKSYNNKCNNLSKFDQLTGAYTIYGFDTLMNRVYDKVNNWAFICFDVDNFKKINNDYGFDSGDALLISIVDKVKKYMCDDGIIGRVESNRFLLAIKSDSEQATEVFIRSLNDKMTSLGSNDAQYTLSYTYGVYISSGDPYDTAKIYAINAWINAKRKNREILFYNEENIAIQEDSAQIVNDGIVNISSEELLVAYTPVVNLETGYVLQTRANYKWVKPNGIEYDDEAMLSIFKSKDVICDFYIDILNVIAKDMKYMKNKYIDLIPVSIKMHSSVFSKTDFISRMNNAIFSSGIKADLIVVEFDANDIINSEAFYSIANSLKENGYGISIDNFAASKMNLDSILKVDLTSATLDAKYSRYGYSSSASQRALNMFINGFSDSMPIIKNVNNYDTMLQIKCFNSECNVEGAYFGKEFNLSSYIQLLEELPFDLGDSEVVEDIVEETNQDNEPEQNIVQSQNKPTVVIQEEKQEIDKESLEEMVLKIINKNQPVQQQVQQPIQEVERRYDRYERYDYYDRHNNYDIENTIRKVVYELFQNKGIVDSYQSRNTENIEDVVRRVMEQYTKNNENKTVVIEKVIQKEEKKEDEESLAAILARLLPIENKSKPVEEVEETPEETIDEQTKVNVIEKVVEVPADNITEYVDEDDDDDDDDDDDNITDELLEKIDSKLDVNKFEELMKEYMKNNSLNVVPDWYKNMTVEQKKGLDFIERINIASKQIKSFYDMLKNAIMEYNGINNVISKRYDTFKLGRKAIIKIGYVGKTIKLFMSLDPSKYPPAQYPHKDVSHVKKHEKTPYMMKVKSNLGLKRALILICDVMVENKLEKNPDYKRCDFIARNRNMINKKIELGIK